MGKLILVGTAHYKGEFVPTPGNYERVMRVLEAERPSFVSQEVKLYNLLSRSFEPILRAPLSELDDIEAKILAEGSYGAEYEAGIIYCRRQNIPLHWTDLYSASQEEVVETDILQANPIESLWADEKEIPARLLETYPGTDEPLYFNVSERNVFTGHALSDLLRKYDPGDGVHICGKGHYTPGRGLPLQVVLDTSSFRPDEIRFEPEING